MIGWTEMIVILFIVLVVFGAGKLPEVGSSLGKGIKNFRKALREPDAIDVTPQDEKEKDTTKNNR